MDYTSSYRLSNILESGATAPEDLASAINHQLFLGLNTASARRPFQPVGPPLMPRPPQILMSWGSGSESLTQNYLLATAIITGSGYQCPAHPKHTPVRLCLPGHVKPSGQPFKDCKLCPTPCRSSAFTDGVNDQGLLRCAIFASVIPSYPRKMTLLPITTTLAVRMMLGPIAVPRSRRPLPFWEITI